MRESASQPQGHHHHHLLDLDILYFLQRYKYSLTLIPIIGHVLGTSFAFLQRRTIVVPSPSHTLANVTSKVTVDQLFLISSIQRNPSSKTWAKAGFEIVFCLVATLLYTVNSLLNAAALHSLRLWSNCLDELNITEYKHDLRLIFPLYIFNVLTCWLIFGVSNLIRAGPRAIHTVAWLCATANLVQLGARSAEPSDSSWISSKARCKFLALVCGNSVLALSTVRCSAIP